MYEMIYDLFAVLKRANFIFSLQLNTQIVLWM